jgi:hypothetical protein
MIAHKRKPFHGLFNLEEQGLSPKPYQNSLFQTGAVPTDL